METDRKEGEEEEGRINAIVDTAPYPVVDFCSILADQRFECAPDESAGDYRDRSRSHGRCLPGDTTKPGVFL